MEVSPIRLGDVGFLEEQLRHLVQRSASAQICRLAERAREIAARVMDGRLHSVLEEGRCVRQCFRGTLRLRRVGASLILSIVTRVDDGYLALFVLRDDGSFGIACFPSQDGYERERHWSEIVSQAVEFEGRRRPSANPNLISRGRTAWLSVEPDPWHMGRFRMEDIGNVARLLDDCLTPDAPMNVDQNDLNPLNVRSE